jgi:hypothetical protein
MGITQSRVPRCVFSTPWSPIHYFPLQLFKAKLQAPSTASALELQETQLSRNLERKNMMLKLLTGTLKTSQKLIAFFSITMQTRSGSPTTGILKITVPWDVAPCILLRYSDGILANTFRTTCVWIE